MVSSSEITDHMDVVGSDGQHVGTVDKLVIKLTKKDPAAQGQHHVIAMDLISAVEGGKISVPVAEAAEQEKTLG